MSASTAGCCPSTVLYLSTKIPSTNFHLRGFSKVKNHPFQEFALGPKQYIRANSSKGQVCREEAGEQDHVPLILILLVSGLRRAVHHFCNCCVTGSSCFSTECRSALSMAYLRLRRLRGFTVESRPLYLCRLSFPPCHASTSPSPITRLRT